MIIKEFDANGDGKVSREELLDGVDQKFVGKTAKELPGWFRENIATFFKSFDMDNNGELSFEELIAMYNLVAPEYTADALKSAYEWVIKISPNGKYDVDGLLELVHIWGTSSERVPLANLVMDPFFKTKA